MRTRARACAAALAFAMGLPLAGDCAATVAADAAVPAPAVHAASRAEQEFVDALAQQLSDSRQPRELLVAARLFRFGAGHGADAGAPVDDARRVARADAAMQRALALGASDPLVLWTAATSCPASSAICDASRALRRLRAIAPSNAAVWVLPGADAAAAPSDRGREPTPSDDIRERLPRIAAASRYDSYQGERLRTYLAAVAPGPSPAADHAVARSRAAPDAAMRLALAARFAFDAAEAETRGLAQLCDATTPAASAAHVADCVAAGERILERADSARAHRAATTLLLRWLPDGAPRHRVDTQRRRLEWQSAALQRLVQADPDAASRALAFWREPGATELQVMRVTLQAAGIALDPPPDWRGWSALELDALRPPD